MERELRENTCLLYPGAYTIGMYVLRKFLELMRSYTCSPFCLSVCMIICWMLITISLVRDLNDTV